MEFSSTQSEPTKEKTSSWEAFGNYGFSSIKLKYGKNRFLPNALSRASNKEEEGLDRCINLR